MAITRFSSSRLTQGLPKYQTAWDSDNVAQGAMEPIGYQIVSSPSVTQVFFNNIPQHYQDLMLVANARQATNNSTGLYIRLNSTAHNRSYTWLEGGGTSVTTSRVAVAGDGYSQIGQIVPSNASAGYFGTAVAHIFNYTNTNTFKTLFGRSAMDSNGSGGVRYEVALAQITSAITSLEIVTDAITGIESGSSFALYGIRSGS